MRVRVGVVGAVVGCFVGGLAGCAPGTSVAKAAPASASAVPAPTGIGKEGAEKVFNQWTFERRNALEVRDSEAIAKVEAGALLEEDLAWMKVLREQRNDKGWPYVYRQPEAFIPADQQGYPRWFVVVSRGTSKPGDERAGALHYFVQEGPGAGWKAAAISWVYDKPVRPGKPEDRSYEATGFEVRHKEIAAFGTDAAGALALSPTAGEDREVCGRYAEYMSFTAPNGEPESEEFVPGELTSEAVKAYNVAYEEDLDVVTKKYGFEVAGAELPVVRLADGKSLVTCSFVRTDTWTGREASFQYTSRAYEGVDVLLGGGHRWWLSTTVRRSVTVTFEVPAQGPADVVGSGNALSARPLSAEGTPK
ncbi:hypothetical protein ACFTWH_12540 [Streptomyces sp. NPDC057011]|uniref:hypothetical protein n=1 Tax=unclassified Streptomyces TaxID=2593676 RepID=UPI003627909F